ncbi:uncharacterized protein F4807DRAFT_239264 [Annulohypoxylon truncatum]|uniref:uncharacterized protein n=1 Tax=Annulohypoxylon truncatum TaxID=327061 RepID=UPI002008867F|nr:uncharacterized protein F4807DRAFT_239264 [Annulohypoxylon truncatum]KAI1206151.1 hypothetical protein F4807DRAFT_239264 [Annulohypoxylon truncatum]
MKPIPHNQAPKSPPPSSSSTSSSSPRAKSNSQTPKPGKTIPAPAPATKPGTQKGRISYDSMPKNQHPTRPLEAAAILSNPRLRQVTGLHPRKASWWKGVHPPMDELIRLQWVMSLPDAYPVKRPKGNF